MSLINSYAIWNNKGGVGKSTITFHVASRYAETNPETNVLVIDLCPQSNASMMLLGGGTRGEDAVFDYCTEPTPRTVVGYLSRVISAGSGAPLPDPADFIVPISGHNSKMPNNLFLLCGDGNLEPMSPAISNAANAPALTPSVQPWKWVHQIFKSMIENLVVADENQDWTVFVDTNPSFAVYTELALSAVDRIICPVNADDSSRVATRAMFILLHGQNPPHPVYGSWTFAARAKQYSIAVPKIHLVVGNRLTQYGGAAKAFGALSDATANALYDAFKRDPQFFTTRSTKVKNLSKFREAYSQPLRDFNTAGVVAAHLGERLSKLSAGNHPVHGGTVQVHGDRVQECLEAVDKVVARLD